MFHTFLHVELISNLFDCYLITVTECFFASFVVFSIVSILRFGRSGVRIEARAKNFSLLQNVHTGSGDPPSPLLRGYQDSFTEVKWPGREVRH